MRLTARQYATALVQFLEKHHSDENVAGAFLYILRKNHQERMLGRILMIAESVWEERHNELRVQARVPHHLSEADALSMTARLEKAFNKKINFTQVEDPKIKGGIILCAGDLLYDATIEGSLERLGRQLSI